MIIQILIGKSRKKKEELKNQMSNIQIQRNSFLLMVENDKQQVIRFHWSILKSARSLNYCMNFDWSV